MRDTMATTATTKMRTFDTLTGAAFMKMEPRVIASLSREEQVRLAFRIRAIMGAIATYMRAMGTTGHMNFQFLAEFEVMKPQDIAALLKEVLEELARRAQAVLILTPFKPGCRSVSFISLCFLALLCLTQRYV
jgi:hypothetical protein